MCIYHLFNRDLGQKKRVKFCSSRNSVWNSRFLFCFHFVVFWNNCVYSILFLISLLRPSFNSITGPTFFRCLWVHQLWLQLLWLFFFFPVKFTKLNSSRIFIVIIYWFKLPVNHICNRLFRSKRHLISFCLPFFLSFFHSLTYSFI